MKQLFLLVKDDSLQVVGGTVEWSPPSPAKQPYGMPVVHTLFGNGEDGETPLTRDFQKSIPKSVFKRKTLVCLPDDYSALETRAVLDFVRLTCRAGPLAVFTYSACAGIQTEDSEYIAVAATKRCVTLCKYVEGWQIGREYIVWQNAEQKIKETIKIWGNLPIYVCDPNELLNACAGLAGEKIYVTEQLFIKLSERRLRAK